LAGVERASLGSQSLQPGDQLVRGGLQMRPVVGLGAHGGQFQKFDQISGQALQVFIDIADHGFHRDTFSFCGSD
jgi:hypothetical protein